MNPPDLELTVFSRHVAMAANENPPLGQHMCAMVLRNLLLDQGLLAELGTCRDATAVEVIGAGPISLVVVPGPVASQRSWHAHPPANWVVHLFDTNSGRLLPAPPGCEGRTPSLVWGTRGAGTDLVRGLDFVSEMIRRLAADGFMPVQVPRAELGVG